MWSSSLNTLKIGSCRLRNIRRESPAPATYRATLLSASLALSAIVGALTALTPYALSHLPTVDLEKVWGIEARYSGGDALDISVRDGAIVLAMPVAKIQPQRLEEERRAVDFARARR